MCVKKCGNGFKGVWGLFLRKRNNNIFDQCHSAVSVHWKDVTVTAFWHKVASGGCGLRGTGRVRQTERGKETETLYVNDVIWFSNPLQSLTQTDSRGSIALIPFPPSLCCCVSLFVFSSFLHLQTFFILLTSQTFSCGMKSFLWLPVVFHMAQENKRWQVSCWLGN